MTTLLYAGTTENILVLEKVTIQYCSQSSRQPLSGASETKKAELL